MRRHLIAAVTLVALCAALLPATPAFAAPPANDDFADARVIYGRDGRAPIDLAEATIQPGEPTYPGDTHGRPHRSVWFRWTAPATAWYHFSIVRMDEDCLSTSPVFQGSSLDSLVRRSHHSANDVWGLTDFSFVRAAEGQTYKIAAAGNCSHDQALVWEQRGPLILSVVSPGGKPVAGAFAVDCEHDDSPAGRCHLGDYAGVTNAGGRVYYHIYRYDDLWQFQLTPRSYNLARRVVGVQVPPLTRNAVFAERRLPAAPSVDLDRDGLGDVVSGVPLADRRGHVNNGAVVIRYGNGETEVLDELSPQLDTNEVPPEAQPHELFGAAVSTGDLDLDGYPDLVIGAPGEVLGYTRPGAVFLVFGSSRGLGKGRVTVRMHQGGSYVAGVSADGDRFGAAVAPSIRNMASHILVGMPGKDSGGVTDSGAVVRFSVPPEGSDRAPLASKVYSQASPGVGGNNAAGDRFGAALAHGGFAMDGGQYPAPASASLAIGVPGKDVGAFSDAGAVVVLRGVGRNGSYAEAGNPLIHQNSAVVPGARARAGNRFGTTLAGFRAQVPLRTFGLGQPGSLVPDWLAVGAPGDGGGSVSVLRAGIGQPEVFSPATQNLVLVQGADGLPGADEPGDRFGAALAVGDLDDDRAPDLIVGAPGEVASDRTRAGGVTMVYGRLTGPQDDSVWQVRSSVAVAPGASGVPSGPTAGNQFGASVGGLDFAGDGYPDVAAGAPGHDATVRNGGAVFGAHHGPWALRGGRLVTWPGAQYNDGFGSRLAAPQLFFPES